MHDNSPFAGLSQAQGRSMDARSVSYLLLSMMICWRGCVPRFTVAERCREPPRMQTRYRRVGLSEAQEQLKGPIGLNCVIILSYHPPFPPPFAGGRKFVIILRSGNVMESLIRKYTGDISSRAVQY